MSHHSRRAPSPNPGAARIPSGPPRARGRSARRSFAMAVRLADAPAVDALRAAFMCLLPRIEAHLAFAFRWLRCPHRRADAVQEAVALAWLGFLRAVSHGKDPSAFAGPLAGYAARRVRVGRRLSGTKSGRDALSPHAG